MGRPGPCDARWRCGTNSTDLASTSGPGCTRVRSNGGVAMWAASPSTSPPASSPWRRPARRSPRAAARRIGDTGHLISTDLPPAMVEVAKRRAHELGIANAEFRVMDAEHIELDDDSVDGVLCRWAFMLMADPGAAMAESRRVLRPGGKLAMAVMGGPAQNPWASTVARSIVELGLVQPFDPNAPGGLFSLADPDRLRQLLSHAGFADVQIEEQKFHLSFS